MCTCRIKHFSSETFAKKLGVVCLILPVIWLLKRFREQLNLKNQLLICFFVKANEKERAHLVEKPVFRPSIETFHKKITWLWLHKVCRTLFQQQFAAPKSFLNFRSLETNHVRVLSQQPRRMAYNTTVALYNLSCVDSVDFEKRQGKFRRFS